MGKKLTDVDCMVLINYVQPSFEELRRRFTGSIDPGYKRRRFNPIEPCKTVSMENREIVFEYVHLKYSAYSNHVLDKIYSIGRRPALYEELICFAEKYPDEQCRFPIAALGSEAITHGYRDVACLWYDIHGRGLCRPSKIAEFGDAYRFLVVRE